MSKVTNASTNNPIANPGVPTSLEGKRQAEKDEVERAAKKLDCYSVLCAGVKREAASLCGSVFSIFACKPKKTDKRDVRE